MAKASRWQGQIVLGVLVICRDKLQAQIRGFGQGAQWSFDPQEGGEVLTKICSK